MVPSPAASGSAQPPPFIGSAEHLVKLVHILEIGLGVSRLSHQQSDFYQEVHDAPQISGTGDTPVAEHYSCKKPELLAGKVPAGPRQLLPRHMPPHLQPALMKFNGGEHEQIRSFVVVPPASPDSRHDIFGELKLVHRDTPTAVALVTRRAPSCDGRTG